VHDFSDRHVAPSSSLFAGGFMGETQGPKLVGFALDLDFLGHCFLRVWLTLSGALAWCVSSEMRSARCRVMRLAQ
jgi:hypothetical protein